MNTKQAVAARIIELCRDKELATNALANLSGVAPSTVLVEFKRIGISHGRRKGRPMWDREGFLAWWHGVPAEAIEETVDESVEDVEGVEETPMEEVEESVCSMPTTGQLTFEGNIDEICNTLKTLLKGADVRMFMKWNLIPNAIPVEVEHG